jgi:hypothetical protein
MQCLRILVFEVHSLKSLDTGNVTIIDEYEVTQSACDIFVKITV